MSHARGATVPRQDVGTHLDESESMMTDGDLGAVMQTFTRRSPLRLVVLVIPFSAVLFAVTESLNPHGSASSTALSWIAAVASVVLYRWLTRRFAVTAYAQLCAGGFRYRTRWAAWSGVRKVTTSAMQGTVFTYVTLVDSSEPPIEISNLLHGDEFRVALIEALQARGVE